jgi:hypothetical protein
MDSSGASTNDLWRFHLNSQVWEKVKTGGVGPGKVLVLFRYLGNHSKEMGSHSNYIQGSTVICSVNKEI